MEILLLVVVGFPFITSIIEGNGRNGEMVIFFIISIALGGGAMMLLANYIGWGALLVGLCVYYYVFYKLDDNFEYFCKKHIFNK